MTDYKQEILDILKLEPHRIGSHSDDYGGESDKPCYCTATQALAHLINKARIDELKDMLEADNDPTQCVHCEILSRIKELEK